MKRRTSAEGAVKTSTASGPAEPTGLSTKMPLPGIPSDSASSSLHAHHEHHHHGGKASHTSHHHHHHHHSSGKQKGGPLQLAISVIGIYTCYLAYGIFQEDLYKKQEDGSYFASTAFTLFVQCLGNALVAFVIDVVQKHRAGPPAPKGDEKLEGTAVAVSGTAGGMGVMVPPPVPGPFPGWFYTMQSFTVARAAFVYVMAMFLSNEALQYVSYPMQALAKSCKMIPVLMGSMIILKKRYTMVKYVCVFLMTAGITLFQFSKPGGGKRKNAAGQGVNDDSVGLLLLFLSLCMDGVTGPYQEEIKHRLNQMEQMMVNNLWGALFMLCISLGMGQFFSAVRRGTRERGGGCEGQGGGEVPLCDITTHAHSPICYASFTLSPLPPLQVTYCTTHPHVVQALFWFSLCSAAGQIFIFYTLRTFDSLTLSTITTTRKFFTIVASVFFYGHVLADMQWVAVLVVFSGIILEVVEGERDKKRKREAAALAAASGASTAASSLEGSSSQGSSSAAGGTMSSQLASSSQQQLAGMELGVTSTSTGGAAATASPAAAGLVTRTAVLAVNKEA